MPVRAAACLALLAAAAACRTGDANAQEIEARAYSPSPIGVTFVALALARSTGAVLTDPSLPVDDVEAEVNGAGAGIVRTFGLFDHLASAGLIVPYVRGDFAGTLDGLPAEASRSGMGDLKLRLVANLLGGPALTPAQFARHKQGTTLNVSLTGSLPTGEYHGDKLINVGTNRWAVKPEIGLSHPIGRWYLEAYAGVWIFGDNDDFFGGQHREQDPLASVQLHASYTIRPRLWLAVDGTFYEGGRSTVDGVDKNDRQSNTRYGLTLSLPIATRHSLRFNWSDGATTRIGSDFTAYGITWTYVHMP